MSRKVEFELDDLLSLLICAEFHEFNHDILYHTISEKIVSLSDEEIDSFLENNNKSEDGTEYSDDEVNNIKQYLLSLRNEFIEIK